MKLFSLVITVSIGAASLSEANQACRDVNQNAQAGTLCVTSAGVIFERKTDSWLDQSSKIFWYDLKPSETMSQREAQKFCEQQGLNLPTGYTEDYNGISNFPNNDSNFVTAEKNGIREVLKDIKGLMLWSSSSMEPVLNRDAYYFSGSDGRNRYYYTTERFSARCISPTQSNLPPTPETPFGEILRDNTGEIIFTTNQSEAKQICTARGQHLSNAREIATLSTRRGSKGILELSDVSKKYNGIVPSGYYLIKAQELGSKADEFYFSHEGYKKPINEMERGCFWTSSGNPDYPPPYYDYKVIFYPSSGKIDDYALYDSSWFVSCAIRCVN